MTEMLAEVAPFEPTTPIKPSEAIRLGCLIAPVQLFDAGYVEEYSRSACAMGAMALGYGGWDDAFLRAGRLFADTPCVRVCPVMPCDRQNATVIHLNDDHRWSREHIADWLAEQGL